MKSSHSSLVAVGYTLVTGLLLVLVLAIAEVTVRGVLLSAIVLTLLIPMAARAITGRLDLFEPLVLANLALGIMFLGRPLWVLSTGETVHLGYDLLTTFDEALFVVLIGIGFFQFGYLSPFGPTWARKMPAPPSLRPQRAGIAGWIYLIVGGLLFGSFLATQGGLGLLLTLLQGRQQSDNELFLGSTGYLYNGILMWGAAALIFFALATICKRRRYWVPFLVSTLSLLVFYGASGGRGNLLPLMLAIPVFWYLWKSRRPSARTLLLAGFVGVALLGWMREVRTAGENRDFVGTLVAALISPVTEAANILGGADADMFDSLANELLVVPEETPFQYGATVTDVLVRAIPRPLWPDKPLESNDAVVTALWPVHYENSRASPAFSVIGPFYADSAYITVALGMFLIGAVLKTSWRWFLLYQTQPVAQMIYAMGLPFVVILMRGTVPDTLSRMLFLVVPLVLLMWLTRLRVGPAYSRIRMGSEPAAGPGQETSTK